ncbi:hypothetical protein K432DRAFT_440898 [Lepidopterella palustris CBS 459.81]|uniref:Uncharacterized protein n=1 Tax=Lepidopterella palustris CBS 459.81 TaxID=1314670 RepID=A0A8E2EG14_9PEZI|nr:hypothetical protein K432DRAFT_440898 [Lepidopterella palustris CBS 459.81]
MPSMGAWMHSRARLVSARRWVVLCPGGCCKDGWERRGWTKPFHFGLLQNRPRRRIDTASDTIMSLNLGISTQTHKAVVSVMPATTTGQVEGPRPQREYSESGGCRLRVVVSSITECAGAGVWRPYPPPDLSGQSWRSQVVARGRKMRRIADRMLVFSLVHPIRLGDATVSCLHIIFKKRTPAPLLVKVVAC